MGQGAPPSSISPFAGRITPEFGLIGSGVDNWAHAGGFIGGYACGFVLSLAERRAETSSDRMLGAGALALTVLGFGLAVWTAVVR